MSQENTQRRGRPSQVEAGLKRDAILSAATQLFLTRGFENVTTRAVAEEANVSTRTLFNLFKDKSSLFIACLEHISPKDSPALTGGDPHEVLCEFTQNMLGLLIEPQGLAFSRVVINDGSRFPELAEASFRNQDAQFVQPLANYLRSIGLEKPSEDKMARLYISMSISEWIRCITYHLPLPSSADITNHARFVAGVFLTGAKRVEER